ncbi:unnamed protein product [Trichobilharzia szidati]|nr:unnamed protein product [Trichobilharzia szidati]
MLLPEHAYGIDLHLHLDGAVRPETLLQISQHRKTVNVPNTLPEFKEKLLPKAPYSLKRFLESFEIIIPLISGDKEVIARICDEFVEDCVQKGGLCYVETRFCPFILTGPKLNAEEVLKTVLEALKISSEKNHIEVRTILSILRHMPETAKQTLELAKKYKSHGVVAIDIAGDDSVLEKQSVANEIVQTFQEAKKSDIHRTVHVGENSSARTVHEAITGLHAERIGHGYHILDDEKLYKSAVSTGVHFELCPSSSIATGAVNMKNARNHPIHRFIEDKVSYSINTDDPTLTQRWDLEEAKYCMEEFGLKYSQLNDAYLNAAKAAFITDEERRHLISHLVSRTRNRIIKI